MYIRPLSWTSIHQRRSQLHSPLGQVKKMKAYSVQRTNDAARRFHSKLTSDDATFLALKRSQTWFKLEFWLRLSSQWILARRSPKPTQLQDGSNNKKSRLKCSLDLSVWDQKCILTRKSYVNKFKLNSTLGRASMDSQCNIWRMPFRTQNWRNNMQTPFLDQQKIFPQTFNFLAPRITNILKRIAAVFGRLFVKLADRSALSTPRMPDQSIQTATHMRSSQ